MRGEGPLHHHGLHHDGRVDGLHVTARSVRVPLHIGAGGGGTGNSEKIAECSIEHVEKMCDSPLLVYA